MDTYQSRPTLGFESQSALTSQNPSAEWHLNPESQFVMFCILCDIDNDSIKKCLPQSLTEIALSKTQV